MAITETPADERPSDAQPLADKSMTTALLLAVFISPLAYYYLGRTKLAVINLLTGNFLLLGLVVVPIHTYKILSNAPREDSFQN